MARPPRSPSARASIVSRRSRGAAVVTALLVVMLATTVISVLLVRQNVTARTVENHMYLSQTRWIERAALDWAKVILRADARSGQADYIGEPWSMPVADTTLDETVTGGAKISDDARSAMLMGQIFDAQAKLNLSSLVQTGEIQSTVLMGLKRLLMQTGLEESLGDLVAARVLQGVAHKVGEVSVGPTLPPITRLDDLRQLPGFDQARIDALRPFLVVLPRATPVNLNTAPAEVIGALVPSLGFAGAQQLVMQRERTYFRNVSDATAAAGGQVQFPSNLFSVASSFFLVRGMVRYGRVESQTETLLERSADRADILWQERF